MGLPFHYLADRFPLIEGDDFEKMVDDVRINGVRDQIVLLDGQILDGRNRYRCIERLRKTGQVLGEGWGEYAGQALQPGEIWPVRHFDPRTEGDPVEFVFSKNFYRRHLTQSQRGLIFAELETLRHGGTRNDQDANLHLDRAHLAKQANVSERTLATAADVRDHGVTALKESVRDGAVSLHAAAEIASQSPERQTEILASLRGEDGKLKPEVKKALGPIIKEIRAEKLQVKRERRDNREKVFAARVLSIPDVKFGIALEDFEWDHEVYSRETGTDRHPSNHYPTSQDAHTAEEIVKRCAERFSCLAPDCIVFKYATIPHLAIALDVLKLQGFEYKTHRIWNKIRPGDGRGPGFWFTGEHEILLVGVRGNIVPPATAHFRSLFDAPVGGHSEKPDEPYEVIEFHWPNVPKIEFNARRRRDGWHAWGFEAPLASGGVMPAPERLPLIGEKPSERTIPMERESGEATNVAHLTSAERPEDNPDKPDAGAVSHVGAGESPATNSVEDGIPDFLKRKTELA